MDQTRVRHHPLMRIAALSIFPSSVGTLYPTTDIDPLRPTWRGP
jgi:hypothetical protein